MLGLTNAIINNLLNNVFHAVWFYMLAVNPKHSRLKMVLLCTVSAAIAEGLSLFTIFNYGVEGKAFTVLYIVGSLVFAYLYIFLLQGGRKLKACFIFFSYICVWAAVYVVAMVIYNNLFYGWEPSIWILRSMFNIALLILYHFFFRARVVKNGVAIEKASGSLIPVSGMAYLLLPLLMIFYAFNTQTTLSLAAILFLLLFALAVYLLIFRFIKQVGRESEMRQIEMQNKLLTEAVQNSEEMERQAKHSRHDVRHHHQILLEYAKNGDSKAIIDYLAEYEQQEEQKFAQILCANRTVNNILQSYLRKAEQNGITVSTNIEMREETAVADMDLVAILGNMLDNAINGCMKVSGERSMEVTVRHQDIKLVLQCKNTCGENIHFENGRPTRKGGIGISSILASTERYSGDTLFSAENGVFTCVVLLNDRR